MSLTDAWMDWKAWFTSLPPEFVFLLALPLLVVLAAFLKHWLTRPPSDRGLDRNEARKTSMT
jgi:hypothetical protein